MPIPFIYPTTGWSTGFMRKRGQRSDNGDDEEATVQQVMDIQRRGQPELSVAWGSRGRGFSRKWNRS